MNNYPTTYDNMAYDGERMRELWAPGDGPGEPDPQLIVNGMNKADGHPTWKLFCGSMDDGPPPRVYLDDQICYEVIASGRFSGHSKGKNWPFDFGQHGNIRAMRPNRCRPAIIELPDGTETFATVAKQAAGGVYYFWGEGGDPNNKHKKKKRVHGFIENEATLAREEELKRQRSPGPMDIVRMDVKRMAAALEALRTEVTEGEGNAVSSPEGEPANKHPRMNIEHLVAKPLDHLDKAELENIRNEYIHILHDSKSLQKRFAQAQTSASAANNQVFELNASLDEMRAKVDEANAQANEHYQNYVRLQQEQTMSTFDITMHRKLRTRLEENVKNLEKKVTELELAKLAGSNTLKQEIEAAVRAEYEQRLGQKEGELEMLLHLTCSLYAHHEDMKKGVQQAVESVAGGRDEGHLINCIKVLNEMKGAAMEELEAAETSMKEAGYVELWGSVLQGL